MSLEIWDDDMAEAMEQAEGQQELEEGVLMENIGEMQQELGGLMESFKDFFEGDDISGDPEKDMENWHHQTEQNSCAVACQEFVAEQLLDREFSEQELIQVRSGHGNARSGCRQHSGGAGTGGRTAERGYPCGAGRNAG